MDKEGTCLCRRLLVNGTKHKHQSGRRIMKCMVFDCILVYVAYKQYCLVHEA